MNRRNAPPRKHKKKPSDLRTVVERLEPRAMLAGLGQDSLSGLGSTTAVLLPGVSSPPGIVLTGGSPTLCSAAGTGGSQSNGPVLQGGSGSGTGSSNSTTGGSPDPNSPVLFSQYTGGSNAGTQGSGTNNGGTLSGSDLWLLYGAGLGAGSSSSGASGGSSSNLLTLLSQYQEGSSASGQGNGTGNTLSNADLWGMYWSGAGAGSSSGPANGSLANAPTISAKYTGGSGDGITFFVTGATGADAANSGSQQGTTGSTTLTLADGQSPVMTTPLVYQSGSDDGPGVVTGVWTGGEGDVQFVLAADQDGDLTGRPLPIGRPGTPVFIVSGSGQGSQVVFDGSDLPPADGPGNPPPGPSRTWCQFLYEVYLADSVTVYGNTSYMEPGERTYTVLGFFIGNLVGVRGVSDAFSDHDAADAHEQSGGERAIDGVFGTIGLVCTALPFAKPAVSATEGTLAKLARSAPPKTAGAAAGAGQVAGSGDDIARGGGILGGKTDEVMSAADDIPVPFPLTPRPVPTASDLVGLGRAAGAGEMTKAGQSLAKHAVGARSGSSAFPAPSGSPANINKQASDLLSDIISDPSSVMKQRPGRPGEQLLQIFRPDGSGVIYKWKDTGWVFSHFAENLF